MEGYLPRCNDIWEHLTRVMPIGEIAMNLDLPWDMSTLVNRSDITVDILMDREAIGREIPWYAVSRSISMDQVREHPTMPWDRMGLSSNPGITADVVRMDLPRATGRWDWDSLSSLLPLSDALDIPEISRQPWTLAMNRDLTLYSARRLGLLDGDYSPVIWLSLSRVVPISNVLTHPHLPWSKWGLSNNPGINLEVIDMNLPKAPGKWDWLALSMNLPMSDIREIIARGDRPLHIPTLSHRKDLSMDIIHLLGHNRDWDWTQVSQYASTDDILNNPGFPWDKEAILIYNKDVDMTRLAPTGGWARAIELAAMPIEEARISVAIGRNIAYNPALTIDDIRYIIDC